ncbi:MAG: inositol monophosphatase [Patescibacteria group bacterium]
MSSDYQQFAVDLAHAAGEVIRRNFMLGMKKEWKSDATPLTESDLLINQMVIDAVKNTFPDHSVLAEEGDAFSEQSEFVWVCDPLDGTVPFSHGIPLCTFSLALTHKGESVLGVIYDPFMDRIYVAEKGKGASLNGKTIQVSQSDTFKQSLFGIVYWKSAPFNFSVMTEFLRNEQAKIMVVASIAYMAALVASGEFVATLFPGDRPHDSAALKIIIEEAGGRVTDVYGNEQRYDRPIHGHIASNGVLHERLVELVRKTVLEQD